MSVHSSEVDDVPYRRPKVVKACVMGVPDELTGEAVKACITVKEGQVATAEEIIAFCRDPRTGLAGYRVPREVETLASLPETATGKVLRRVLLEQERETAARPA